MGFSKHFSKLCHFLNTNMKFDVVLPFSSPQMNPLEDQRGKIEIPFGNFADSILAKEGAQGSHLAKIRGQACSVMLSGLELSVSTALPLYRAKNQLWLLLL